MHLGGGGGFYNWMYFFGLQVAGRWAYNWGGELISRGGGGGSKRKFMR